MIAQLVPWLAGLAALVVGFISVYFRGKSTGKSETQADSSLKTSQQAAEAAKVVNDVRTETAALPPGGAADRLRSSWGVRK